MRWFYLIILLNLRQENKYIKSEINKIKNILKANNNNILNVSNILRNNSALNRNLKFINYNIENKFPNQIPKKINIYPQAQLGQNPLLKYQDMDLFL